MLAVLDKPHTWFGSSFGCAALHLHARNLLVVLTFLAFLLSSDMLKFLFLLLAFGLPFFTSRGRSRLSERTRLVLCIWLVVCLFVAFGAAFPSQDR